MVATIFPATRPDVLRVSSTDNATLWVALSIPDSMMAVGLNELKQYPITNMLRKLPAVGLVVLFV